jgi:adenosylcobyric acid synthase
LIDAALDAIAETLERHLDIDALIALSELAGSDAAGNGERD